jgi:hypothetical protein
MGTVDILERAGLDASEAPNADAVRATIAMNLTADRLSRV